MRRMTRRSKNELVSFSYTKVVQYVISLLSASIYFKTYSVIRYLMITVLSLIILTTIIDKVMELGLAFL